MSGTIITKKVMKNEERIVFQRTQKEGSFLTYFMITVNTDIKTTQKTFDTSKDKNQTIRKAG